VAQTRLFADGASGIWMMDKAFQEVRDIVEMRHVSATDFRELDGRLQRLDEAFPDASSDLRNTLLEFGTHLIREDHTNSSLSEPGWRFFFSGRLRAASAFASAELLIRRILEARKLPWSEEQIVYKEVRRELDEFRDPLLSDGVRNLFANQHARQTRAALRLLRFAVHYQATGETLEIEDSLGGSIRFILTEKTLLAWHQRLFGKDDWQPKPGPSDYSVTIKIEVPRR
jgi:hypothetical protein